MADGFSAPVLGVYCERGLDPSFWAEPVNAVTNLGFIVAGAVMLARRRGDPAVAALAVVTLAIGVGSFLFHTFATRAAMLADVIPIQGFIALYFFFALRRFFGLGAIAAVLGTLAFMAAASALPALLSLVLPPVEPWRGLGGYLGGLFGLVGVGAALLARPGGRETGLALLAIALLFAVSLVFRSTDGAVCALMRIGAHPLWHLTNAAVLYLLMEVLARARRART